VAIGSLFVELGINTAAFKSGLDKATYEAKAFAKEVSHSFSELGGQLRELAGEFDGFGGQLVNSFSGVANAIEPLVGALGTAGGAAAGISVAFAAAGIGAIGAAVHFTEAAHHLNDLSKRTGVAVADLSLLGQVASTAGVPLDSLAKALEKMDKAALAAAQGGPKANNAFKELGVSVTDAEGHMRETKEIFDDVAAAFQKMPEGPQRTAEAIKIFGRAGAELIPLLSEKAEKLRSLEDHFKNLNAVIDGPTAEASDDFRDQIKVMGAAVEGIENQLTKDLVPALGIVADQLISFFEDNQTEIKSFADGLANVAIVILNVFQEVGLIFSLIYRVFVTAVDELQVFGGAVAKLYDDIKNRKFGNIWSDLKDSGKEAAGEFSYNWGEAVKSVQSTIAAMAAANEAKLPAEKKKEKGNLRDPRAGADTTFVDKLVNDLERQARTEEELAQSIGKVSEATIEATATAQANEAIQKLVDEATQKGIQNTKEFKDALAAAIPKIQDATLWFATFKAAIDTQQQFDKFTQNINKQVKALEDEAKAGTAVEQQWAKNNATLNPLKESLDAVSAEYDKLRDTYGEQDKRVQDLGAKVASLTAQYQLEIAAVNRLNVAFQQSKANEEAKKLDTAIAQISASIESLKSGDGFLNVALQVDLLRKNVGLTEDQLASLRGKMEELRNLQIQQALGQKEAALGFDKKTLNDISLMIRQLGDDWKVGAIGEQEYHKVLAELNKEQADLEAKTGGFTSGIKAALADFHASTKSAGETMQEFIGKGLQGIEDNFASMVATGKADWGSLIADMETMLLKSAIHNILNSLFSSLGGLFGGGGGGGIGGFFGSIFSGFGGGKAVGGDVSPGKTYLVGEKGPELFTPSTAGTIIPNGATGGAPTVIQNWNISTPDADSFKRSKSQIQSEMFRAAANAHARSSA
jgi:lambda family phage tail tape measure protein